MLNTLRPETRIRKHPDALLGWEVERKHWQSDRYILVGVDEAGRGPLAGPVVAAAVSFPFECCRQFPKELRALDDSKLVRPEVREDLYDAIQLHADAFGIGVVEAEQIDAINILQATMRAMTMAIEVVVMTLNRKGRELQMLLVDGNYFRTELRYPFQTIIAGDGKSPHIAAASVLAKVTRDRLMITLHERYPEYNFARHKGYATAEHREAIRLHGLSPVHRKSFELRSMPGESQLFDVPERPEIISQFAEPRS